jgi:hypothetical protein
MNVARNELDIAVDELHRWVEACDENKAVYEAEGRPVDAAQAAMMGDALFHASELLQAYAVTA